MRIRKRWIPAGAERRVCSHVSLNRTEPEPDHRIRYKKSGRHESYINSSWTPTNSTQQPSWVGFGGSCVLRQHTGARWHAGEQLTTPRALQPQRATAEGEHHRHPQPNPPAVYICAGPFQKPDPPSLSPKVTPTPMHHLFSLLSASFCSSRKDGLL